MTGNDWEAVYRNYPLNEIPWHASKPDKFLINLVNKGGIKPGSVLDMCSGDGTNSIYLSSKGFKVSGIDISPTAVRIAKKRCLARALECSYVIGDILKKQFGEKFDLILDRGCFHHISEDNKPRYVSRIIKLLKKNGKVYLQCFSDKNPLFAKNLSKEDIYNFFSEHFNIVFIKDSVHTEPDSGQPRYLYSVFMEKRLNARKEMIG